MTTKNCYHHYRSCNFVTRSMMMMTTAMMMLMAMMITTSAQKQQQQQQQQHHRMHTKAFTAVAASSSSSSNFVKLTDQTFEHQTQASTGMTTGSWFVFFVENSKTCDHACQQITSTIRKLSSSSSGDTTTPTVEEDEAIEDEEESSTTSLTDQGILFASVDCETSPTTCSRFNVLPPALLYFHKKAMYPYPGGLSGTSSSSGGKEGEQQEEEEEFFNTDNVSEELVRKFVLEDFKLLEGMEIPPPPSPFEELLSPLFELYEIGMKPENKLLFMAIGGMAVMLLGTILVLIKTLLFPSSSSSVNNGTKSTKTAAKKTKTKTKTKKS